MRVGIILHGPEIVDLGSAKWIIDAFKQEHEVIAKLGGTMGRTAVLDAGLEGTIDISEGLTPSETVLALKDRIDLAILLNHGKTPDTGRCFGRIIASKLDKHAYPTLIHIERPDCNGRIIYYSPEAAQYAEYVRKLLMKHHETCNLPIERGSRLPLCVRIEGSNIIRRISGTFPGESIRLAGIVIGEVTHPEPEIVCKDGRVVELRGGKLKPHGLEKLKNRRIDLFTAKVKTGGIRRSPHRPLIKKTQPLMQSKIAIIDHCAESTFELIKGAGIVITVGDDTTAIAADILTRFGIPVIGITDGDPDCILEEASVPAGSVIIRVRPGFDDILGRKVFEKLMKSKQQCDVQGSNEILAGILALAEKYIIDIKYY